MSWALLDLGSAVARLERIAINPKLNPIADFFRTCVAEILGLPYEQHRRKVWSGRTGIFQLDERDIP